MENRMKGGMPKNNHGDTKLRVSVIVSKVEQQI
jgi:hypothetical protein